MSDTYGGAYTPQFTVPNPTANAAAVPDEFVRYADVLSRTFNVKPPVSDGSSTTGEVGL